MIPSSLWPAFFDIFGFVVFVYITALAFWMLSSGNKPPRPAIILLLLIGLVGLIVDGVIVYLSFF